MNVWLCRLPMGYKGDCGGDWRASKGATVRNEELASLLGLGVWVLQECMQILKLPFIKMYT